MCYKQMYNKKHNFRLNKTHTLEEISHTSGIEKVNLEYEFLLGQEDAKANGCSNVFAWNRVYLHALTNISQKTT